jgi:hypothetical protein
VSGKVPSLEWVESGSAGRRRVFISVALLVLAFAIFLFDGRRSVALGGLAIFGLITAHSVYELCRPRSLTVTETSVFIGRQGRVVREFDFGLCGAFVVVPDVQMLQREIAFNYPPQCGFARRGWWIRGAFNVPSSELVEILNSHRCQAAASHPPA